MGESLAGIGLWIVQFNAHNIAGLHSLARINEQMPVTSPRSFCDACEVVAFGGADKAQGRLVALLSLPKNVSWIGPSNRASPAAPSTRRVRSVPAPRMSTPLWPTRSHGRSGSECTWYSPDSS